MEELQMMNFLIFAGFNSKFRANNTEILPSILTSEYRRNYEREKLDAIDPSSSSLTFTNIQKRNVVRKKGERVDKRAGHIDKLGR